MIRERADIAADAARTDCLEAKALLFRLASGSDPAAEEALAHHLHSCRRCRAETAAAEALFDGLSSTERTSLFRRPIRSAAIAVGIAATLAVAIAGASLLSGRWSAPKPDSGRTLHRRMVIIGDEGGITARANGETIVVLPVPSPPRAIEPSSGADGRDGISEGLPERSRS